MKKLFLILTIVLISGCVQNDLEVLSISTDSGEKQVYIEIAETEDQKRTGLMNRESLPQNQGMLFVFEGERIRSFWMKNTLIPLDIIFIDENLIVVDIQTMEPCRIENCMIYNSEIPAKYALEVNKDWAEANGIEFGDKVTLPL